jgi:uncharacterized glyoxalase superfamily protein PhnB
MPEECQSIPITAPKDWNQKGCASRRSSSSRLFVDNRLGDYRAEPGHAIAKPFGHAAATVAGSRPTGRSSKMTVQISVATEGGSGTSVPDLSIEVDQVDPTLQAMKASGFPIEYEPIDEPWSARRFYVRNPLGKLVNILAHRHAAP